MASSEKRRRFLKFLSKNNIVAVLLSGLVAVFAPHYLPVAKPVIDLAEKATDDRIDQHIDKHEGAQ